MNAVDHEPRPLGEHELHALADGVLPRGRAREVAWAAALDPASGERLAAIRRQNATFDEIRRGLGQMNSETFSPTLQRELVEAMRRQPRRWGWARLGAAAAAAAALALMLTGSSPSPGASRGPRRTEATVTPAWAPEVPLDRALAHSASSLPADGVDAALADLGRQLSAEAPHLAELERMGLRFAGAEVLDGTASPAVHLVFRDAAGAPVSLYVSVASAGAIAAFAAMPEGRLALQWRQGPFVFALVSGVASVRLEELMAHITAGPPERKAAVAPVPNQTAAAGHVPGPTARLAKDPSAGGPVQPAVLPAEVVAPAPRTGSAAQPAILPAEVVTPAPRTGSAAQPAVTPGQVPSIPDASAPLPSAVATAEPKAL